MNLNIEALVKQLTGDNSVIAVAALLIAQVIADGANDIVKAIDRASGNS